MPRPGFESLLPILISLVAQANPAAAPLTVAGAVTDSTGRALPRALVTVRSGDLAVASAFADERGMFRVRVEIADTCSVEASMAGFRTAVERCSIDPLRLTLVPAPVSESIVVTATRDEAPAGQLAASVSVFERADIERRQAPLLADLLRTAAGATVVRVGGYGNITSLFVRGGESNYNKVLLDGIPLNEPGGTFNFSNVGSVHLERVELVRGAHSALFGSDAMAGVVQMFSRRAPSGRTEATFSAEGGSLETGRLAVAVSGARAKADYSLGAARLVTDNEVPNNTFRNTTLSGTAGVLLPREARLRFVARAELGRAGVPGATAFGRPDRDALFDRRDGVAGVTFTHDIGDAVGQRATYAIAFSNQESINRNIDPPYVPALDGRRAPFPFRDFPYDSETDLRRHHLAYQADWRVHTSARAAGTHLLTAALDWDGERATLSNRIAPTSVRARRDNFGWTIQHQALWPTTFVTAGIRIENNDSFGLAAVPRIAMAHVVRAADGTFGRTRLKGALGYGIKEPTILQSFSPTPSFLGNPDLEPERSRSAEAGIEQRLLNDRAKVELTWFANRFRDIISTRTLGFNPFTAQYFNVGLTRARGLELTFEMAPLPALRFRGGYTFLDSSILESTAPANPVFREGQSLFRRPRHSGFALLMWSWGALTLDSIGTFAGRRVDSDFAALDPPMLTNRGHARWDLRGTYRISRRLSLLGALDNALDADYMEPLGYPSLGRAARAGVRLTY